MGEKLYNCLHCGIPTKGKVVGMIGKKVIREMCQACKDYIGSPAAQQEGATMDTRIEMERKLSPMPKENRRCQIMMDTMSWQAKYVNK